MFFVRKINNNTFGSCYTVDTIEDGINLMREILKKNGVDITDEVNECLQKNRRYRDDLGRFTLFMDKLRCP
jgi:hypothetical protein